MKQVETCISKVIFSFKKRKNKYGDVISFVNDSKDINEAVERAYKSRDRNGRMDNHQRRVGEKVLLAALEKFNQLHLFSKLDTCKNFNCIYEIIKKTKPYRFGGLTIYDIALRIALYKRIEPDFICLAGSGPYNAVKIINSNIKISNRRVEKNEIEKIHPLITNSGLKPFETEIILCDFMKCYKQN
jgi:hypothetical protein